MNRLTEKDCLNALVDRTIKAIEFTSGREDELRITLHDGLSFIVSSHAHDDNDNWLQIRKAEDE